MRWLLFGLLISVGALLLVAAAVARHILRQRRNAPFSAPETDPANELPATTAEHQPPAEPPDRNPKI